MGVVGRHTCQRNSKSNVLLMSQACPSTAKLARDTSTPIARDLIVPHSTPPWTVSFSHFDLSPELDHATISPSADSSSDG